jgi:serine/threonine-protein kinase
LVDGQPLSTLLREDGPLSPEDTLSVLRQTAEALAEAHHVGLVHRDVKPGNILVSAGERVKITDFGIAWSAGSVPLTQAGQVVGTPQYLSPELAVGDAPSPASDVYSLGLVGYECLTGEPAFDGDNPVSVALKQVQEVPEPLPADLPAGLRELVDVAVAKDPAERPPDGDAFVAAIDRIRAEQAHEGEPTTTWMPRVGASAVPGGHHASRRRRGVLLAAVLLAIGAGLVVLLGLPGGGRTPAAGAPVAAASEPEPVIALDPAAYVGRPVDEVATELTALGLTVARQQQVTDSTAPNAVIRLDHADGDLHTGDAVTVLFAAPPPVRPAPGTEQEAPVQAADSAAEVSAGGVGSAVAGTAEVPSDAVQTTGSAPVGSSGSTTTGTTAGTSTDVSTAATDPTTGAPTGSDAATGTSAPSSPEPSTAEPSTAEPSSPDPSTSDPGTSEPSTPSAAKTPAPSTPSAEAPAPPTP